MFGIILIGGVWETGEMNIINLLALILGFGLILGAIAKIIDKFNHSRDSRPTP